jgi:predicted RNA binding protein YcfA (HicA-like mRNA interferase family)
MPKLPNIKPKILIKKLNKLGFIQYRQKGSHVVMVNQLKNKQVIVPVHNKELKKGTLASILRQGEIALRNVL